MEKEQTKNQQENQKKSQKLQWHPAFCSALRLELLEDAANLEFVERFPELSLFFKAYSLLDSEMICIFPYFCPYAESAREIREIFS